MKTAVLSPDELQRMRQKRPLPWPWLAGGLVGLIVLAFALFQLVGGDTPSPTPDPTATATSIAVVFIQPTDTPSATPTATATSSPTPAAAATVTRSTPTHTPSPTTIPIREVIGRSVNGIDIEAIGFGSGENVVVFVGGLHAGYTPASVALAEQVAAYFAQNTADIPENVQLFIIPNANPDSPLDPGNVPGRLNANGVDLNRNWDCRWQQDAQISGQLVAGAGGTAPFSEPEVQGLSQFLLAQKPVAVVFWEARAADGLVSPGSCEGTPKVSQAIAEIYGAAAGYQVRDFELLTQQVVNGDGTNWLDDHDIPAISVLLPEYAGVLDWEANLTAVLAIVEAAVGE
jgi:hypothetical protein